MTRRRGRREAFFFAMKRGPMSYVVDNVGTN
jgi:hypothetical protein